MAIPLTVAWELVRLYLHNRQPPYSKPWKLVSGDGKSHSTNFCDRSIIMQTAVCNVLGEDKGKNINNIYEFPSKKTTENIPEETVENYRTRQRKKC